MLHEIRENEWRLTSGSVMQREHATTARLWFALFLMWRMATLKSKLIVDLTWGSIKDGTRENRECFITVFLPAVIDTVIYKGEKASLLDYEIRYRGYRAREIATRGWRSNDGRCAICVALKRKVYSFCLAISSCFSCNLLSILVAAFYIITMFLFAISSSQET